MPDGVGGVISGDEGYRAGEGGLDVALIADLQTWITVRGMTDVNPTLHTSALVTKLRGILEGASALPCAARIVLNHGRFGADVVQAPDIYRGPLGACYANSLRAAALLAGSAAGWSYCEGFAYQPRFDLALPHAWLLNPEGVVMETTWTNDDATYLGIAFELSHVAQAANEAPGAVLHDDWTRGMRVHESHRGCCSATV